MAVDVLALTERVAAEIREAIGDTSPDLDEVRRMLNEAGVRNSRARLAASLDGIEQAQQGYRVAQAALDHARQAHEQAVMDAEWELDACFVVEGNKTWLVMDGAERKAMTVDERRAWKTATARNRPEVCATARALADADESAAASRDLMTLAERRFSAAKADLAAAVAELAHLGIALGVRR